MTDYLKTHAGDVQRSQISRDHPTAVWVSLLRSDAPLRSQMGGRPYEPPSDATHVIVEDWRAADRLIGALWVKGGIACPKPMSRKRLKGHKDRAKLAIKILTPFGADGPLGFAFDGISFTERAK